MCGLLFYLKKNKKKINKIEKKKLIESSKLIYHRGPDFNKYIIDNNKFIFHSRLSILDLSTKSNQPIRKKYKNNTYTFIYNGEIYNFQNLRSQIISKNKINTTGDTEVLFLSYLINQDKNNFMRKLNGMFSFLVIRDDDEVFFARDRYGQKPLYFVENKKIIAFSSEIKPLLNILGKRNIDEDEVENYIFKNSYFNSKNTLFKNIKQVSPSEYGYIKNNNIYFKNYYIHPKKKKKLNDKKFFNLFKKNILRHTVSDKKIAISLSSGIDSQSIAHILFKNKKINYDLMSYSIDFDGFKSEFSDAKKFTDSYKKNIKKVFIDENFVINNFEKYFIKNEGPIGGLIQIGMFKLCEQVKQDGYDVLLAGFGLDECLGSYKELRSRINKTNSTFNLIDKTLINNNGIWNINYNEMKNRIIDEYFFETKIPRTTHFVDRLSMASSVELRLPFLEHSFVEKCINLKIDLKKKDKYLVRKYMSFNSDHKKNWFKGKEHVPHPQNTWMRNGKLSYFISDIINNNYLYKNYKALNKNKILKEWKLFKNYDKESGYLFWQLINLYYLMKLSKSKNKF